MNIGAASRRCHPPTYILRTYTLKGAGSGERDLYVSSPPQIRAREL